MSTRPGARLRPRTGPICLIRTAAPWAATAYLGSYVVLGPVLFGFLFAVLVVAAATNITWFGVPIAVGAAGLVRGCATVERARAGVVGPPIVGGYRAVTASGVFAQARTRWSDPATLRDCAYLLLFFPLLLLLDAAALVLWLSILALVTLPAWFWAIPQTWPNGETGKGLMIGHFPDGPGGGGVGLWIGDIGTALAVSAGAVVVAALVGAPAVTAAARLHLRLADRLLGIPADPLAEAKRVLDEPGPLPVLSARG